MELLRTPRALAGPVALGLEGEGLSRVRDAMVEHIGLVAKALIAAGMPSGSCEPVAVGGDAVDPAWTTLSADPAFEAAQRPPTAACLQASAEGDETAQAALLTALIGDCPHLRRYASGTRPMLALAAALGRAWDSDLHPATDVGIHFIQPPLVSDTLKVIYTCGREGGRSAGARHLTLMVATGFAGAAGLV